MNSYRNHFSTLLKEIERLENCVSNGEIGNSLQPFERETAERIIRSLKCKLADDLVANELPTPLKQDGRIITPYWQVDGVPSKASKKEAKTWMAKRNIDWDGSAPRLCREVRTALEKNELVPYHNFDLFVRRTVHIEKDA
jgi:hypothetical protein